MKRILIFASIALVALVSSCKKDPTAEELLIGKWTATKVITDNENIVGTVDDYKTEVDFEFKQDGIMALTITESDLSTNPIESETFTIAGTYSWSGGNLTLGIDDGIDVLSVTGTAEVSESKFTFIGTSGDVDDFISQIEADKK